MRRTLVLLLLVALGLSSLLTAPVAARKPLSLGASSQSSTDMAAVDAFTLSAGARPALWTLWSSWGDRGGSGRCVKGLGTCGFPGVAARGLRERGITPSIYWQPTDPGNPTAGRFERYRNIIAGKHDRYIRAWARAARNFGRPVVVRFAHEMNGTWFPWSLSNFDNSPGTFSGAWRHIVREFRRVGARNVRFLWSPFQICTTCSDFNYQLFYPGNRYVDYVGVTALNWGDATWNGLDGLLGESLAALRQMTRTKGNPMGKPVILPEVGSNYVGGDKAVWIVSGYKYLRRTWPSVRALVYFDYDTTFAGQPDWRLAMPPDGSALAAYRALATQRKFRAAFPLRPAPGPDRWRLMPLADAIVRDEMTHIVAQDGSGEFTTIAEAVAVAQDGHTIRVKPGIYAESVIVDKVVTITGDGDRASVVIAPSPGVASFALSGVGATLANMTLRGGSATVTVSGGAPTLTGLSFESVGVSVDGVSATPAIDVTGGSTAQVRGNTISGGIVGIRVADGAPLLEANDIAGTSWAGVITMDAGAAQLVGNNVHDNVGSGVVVGQGAPNLSANTIVGNATGLILGAVATPTLTGNIICGNAINVQVLDDGPVPDMTGNEVCPDGIAEGAAEP